MRHAETRVVGKGPISEVRATDTRDIPAHQFRYTRGGSAVLAECEWTRIRLTTIRHEQLERTSWARRIVL